MNTLQKYDPFRDMWNLTDEVGRLFWGLGHQELKDHNKNISFVPALDIAEDHQSMSISIELPGLQKDDIQLKIRDGILTISGEKKFQQEDKKENYYRIERNYGNFMRSFSLPKTFDQNSISAEMKDGVLKVQVAKKPEAQEKEIKVEVH